MKRTKAAIVVSGLLPKNPEEIKQRIENSFGECYDIYYGAWEHENQKQHDWIDFFPDVDMHYNPYKEQHEVAIQKLREGVSGQEKERYESSLRERSKGKHRSKQILIHGRMIKHNELDRKYPVIMRFRWDLEWGNKLLECLLTYTETVANSKRPVCFLPNNSESFDPQLTQHFGDCLIIHHASRFDIDYMEELHNQKRLQGGESGWWQMLCEAYKKKPAACWEGHIKLTSDLLRPGIKSYFNPPFKVTDIKFVADRPVETRKDLMFKQTDFPDYPILEKKLKVAVLFSGRLPRQSEAFPEKNIKAMREMLPEADIFCTSWTGQPAKPYINRYHEEPAVLNSSRDVIRKYISIYRKFRDSDWDLTALPEKWQNDSSMSGSVETAKHNLLSVINNRKGFANQNKQQLAYAMAYRDFIDDHDIVIRMRYDTQPQPELAEVLPALISKAYNENIVLGFHHFTRKLIDILDPRHAHEEIMLPHVNTCLRDFMIIHKADQFNPQNVFELYNTGELKFAEEGWHQILCQPNNLSHQHYISFVKLDHQVLKEENARRKYRHIDIHRDYEELKQADIEFQHPILAVNM